MKFSKVGSAIMIMLAVQAYGAAGDDQMPPANSATPATATPDASDDTTTTAGTESPKPDPAPSDLDRQMPRIKKRVKVLKDELVLNDDQQKKIIAIMIEQLKSLKEADKIIAPADKNIKYASIQDATERQILGVLTPDQGKKFEAMGSIRSKDTVPMAQINRHTKWLREHLSLNDDQEKQVASVLVDEVKLMREIDLNKETTPAEKEEQRSSILTSIKASIRNLLTPAQKHLFESMDVKLEVGRKPQA